MSKEAISTKNKTNQQPEPLTTLDQRITPSNDMESQSNALYTKWQNLLQEEPKLRIRNAAERLGVSEAELLATTVGKTAVRLKPQFRDILKDVETFGKVMALTRNEHVVHERKGVYENAQLDGDHFGLFVNPDIDLRIFWAHWHSVYAVTLMRKGHEYRSLHFFDASGTAVHKIHLVTKSDGVAFEGVVAKYRSDNQAPFQTVEDAPEPKVDLADEDIDVSGFQQAWRDLKDTHDFFGVLRKFKVGRQQAMRLAPEGNYAVPVGKDAFRQLVNQVVKSETPIMVFVGNRGMIQIHTGPVKRLLDYGTWFNIMDPDFNLHLNEAAIASSFVVRKPTEDGTVTSLEVFDESGEMIVQVFGKRKPGIPELEAWRQAVQVIEQNVPAMS